MLAGHCGQGEIVLSMAERAQVRAVQVQCHPGDQGGQGSHLRLRVE